MRHQAVVGNARMGTSMESKLRGSLRRLGAGARRLTHEAVPRLANYSNMFQMATTGARPTMEDLHESIVEDKVYLRLGDWLLAKSLSQLPVLTIVLYLKLYLDKN